MEDPAAATALNYFAYNFIKIHRTLRMSPAMAAGVSRYLSGARTLHTRFLWDDRLPPWERLLRILAQWCTYGQRPHLSPGQGTDQLLDWHGYRDFRISRLGVHDCGYGVPGMRWSIRDFKVAHDPGIRSSLRGRIRMETN